jgi:1-phosphofructokinase family hexose kinase
MTLVVCPNLAVDRILSLPALRPGVRLRARLLAQQAGGKGPNVLRALRALGGDGRVLGLAGGATGRYLSQLAAEEGLAVERIACDGEGRVSTVVLTADGRPPLRLHEYGPAISDVDEHALLDAIGGHAAGTNDWAIVNGAAQPGSSDGFYGALCDGLRRAGYRVMVDATGAQLAGALGARPEMVKVNRAEARAGLGDAPGEEAASGEADLAAEGLELCQRLVRAGARDAVVTLAGAGAVGLIRGRAWRVTAPPVTAVNTTGSGDCFAAALLLAFERGDAVRQALAAAAGVGAANAADAVTSRFDPALARELAGRAFVGPPGPGAA